MGGEPKRVVEGVKAAEQNITDPSGADDAALDAIVARLQKENDSVPDDSAANEVTPQTVAEPVKEPVKSEAKPQDPAGTPQEVQPKTPEVPLTLEQLQVENEKLRTQSQNNEQMLQRWGNEMGEIRNLANQTVYNPVPQNGVPQVQPAELDLTDPVQMDTFIQQKVDQRQQQQNQLNVQNRLQAQQIEMSIRTRHPEFDSLVDDMAKLAAAKGLPAQNVAIFKSNPFNENQQDLETLILEVKHNRQIAELNTKIANLGNQNGDQLRKIVQVANEEPAVTVNSGQASTTAEPSLTDLNFPAMSDAEFEEAGKHLPRD